MIDTLLTILKIVIAVAPLVLFVYFSNKVNLPKSDRSRQFAMPVIALVFVIAYMLLIDPVNQWLLNIINSIPSWIYSLASVSWMPNFLYTALTWLGNFLSNLLSTINFNYWIFFIANAVVMLIYVALKKVCIAIIAKTVSLDGKVHTRVASWFYRYFFERNFWCLKESFTQVRNLLLTFYLTTVGVSCVLMAISVELFKRELLLAAFYPVCGIIVIGEMYFYLAGLTQGEYGRITGENDEAFRMTNYSLLRKFLRTLFKDKLLHESTGLNNPIQYTVTTEDVIAELEKNEDPKVISLATYFKALNKTGFRIDHNYLASTIDLLNGKSILFNNPFYNDLIPYAFYPMNRALLSHKKVLVVLGRHAIEEDISAWIEEGIGAVTNIPFMWNVRVLDKNDEGSPVDIGIMTRSSVLDTELHQANSQFLEEVGFVVIIEPSKLITTAQIGMNMLIKRIMGEGKKEITYCMCDKNCDGLVDAMSHILMANITEVSATNKHQGTSSYMCWEANKDFLHHRLMPNISRYLGFGTELSFAALKNQIAKAEWYGGDAFPVTDMRWIDRQYYYDLTHYAGLPTNQESMDEFFKTSSNFWSARVEKNNYFTVEDEDHNLFEILRDFSTRTSNQGFINVISSNYLLREYMTENAAIFETDPKAIPHIVADYARTHRNVTLKLLLAMSVQPVSTQVIEKELAMLGITVFNLEAQLWFEIYKCFQKTEELKGIYSLEYREAVAAVSEKAFEYCDINVTRAVLSIEDVFNLKSGKMETVYSINDKRFVEKCIASLKCASYMAEDETGEKHYLGAELCGQIYQKLLPGQFFTFGGKYYEMQFVTPDGQVLVRRAADHITGRPQYRQIRGYVFDGIRPSDMIGAQRDVNGLKIVTEYCDFAVGTSGYYLMDDYGDFTTAKRIVFDGNGIPVRTYRNKQVLRLTLPKTEEGGEDIRYTLTVLLNEIFRTIFADNQAYICALTAAEDEEGPLTYTIAATEGCAIDPDSIYIVEDCQLDLGLLVAVERNLQRILEIAFDYLLWHEDMLFDSLMPPDETPKEVVITTDKPKKKGFFGKMIDKIRGVFGKKKKKPDDDTPVDDTPTDDTPVDDTPKDDTPDDTVDKKPKKKKGLIGKIADLFRRKKKKTPTDDPTDGTTDGTTDDPTDGTTDGTTDDPTDGTTDGTTDDPTDGTTDGTTDDPTDGTTDGTADDPTDGTTDGATDGTADDPKDDKDGADGDGDPIPRDLKAKNYPKGAGGQENALEDHTSEDDGELEEDDLIPERKDYSDRYYLLFGGDNEPKHIAPQQTKEFLAKLGFDKGNFMTAARDGISISVDLASRVNANKRNVRVCDFCGTEIYGVEYETLADGRDRCIHCSKTAIKSEEEFIKIFEDVRRNMESFFGIRLNVSVRVEMVNARTLHKRLNESFTPTPRQDGRVLGVAIRHRNGDFSLMVENGSPRMMSVLTMAHELTHIWQYVNWDARAIHRKYKDIELEVYEGMSKWVEVQYAYLINEPALAKQTENSTALRNDPYGYGFLRYRENYHFSMGTYITKMTPFMFPDEPLAMEYCGEIYRLPPGDDSFEPSDDHGGADVSRRRRRRRGKGADGADSSCSTGASATSGGTNGAADRDVENVNLYTRSTLCESERSLYDTFFEAIMNFVPSVKNIPAGVTKERLSYIIEAVIVDNPQIFWFRYNEAFYVNTSTGAVEEVALTYRYTKAEADEVTEKILATIKPFIEPLNEEMSDFEVVLRVYQIIVDLVDYDTVALEKQDLIPYAERADKPDPIRTIVGVFVDKKAVCAGYARAFQFLLKIMGIESAFVSSGVHAWNIVKLEGDYYHVDVTWADSSDTKTGGHRHIDYSLFCITEADVLRIDSHTFRPEYPMPKATATKCNYHHRFGFYMDTYNDDKVLDIVCRMIEARSGEITLRFKDDAERDKAYKILCGQNRLRDMIRYASHETGVRTDVRYVSYAMNQRPVINVYVDYL